MREYTVWFVWDTEPKDEEALTGPAKDAEDAVRQIQENYEPVTILAVMPFELWKQLNTHSINLLRQTSNE